VTESKQKNKKVSRRDTIKLLGAVTGATVLANLPSKWSTPEIARGVLPAHAQTSQVLYDLTCEEDIDTMDFSLDDPEPFSVTINSVPNGSPLNGISMTWTVVGTPSASGQGTTTGTLLTDASGFATIDLGNFALYGWLWDGLGSATVRWTFTNDAQGFMSGIFCEQTNSWLAIV
jgi:hypothetical protein